MTAREYAKAIRASVANCTTDEELALKVDRLKCERLRTLKDFAFVQKISYRTVLRRMKKGSLNVIETPQGKRILAVTSCHMEPLAPYGDSR
jgi:hypothetical protein